MDELDTLHEELSGSRDNISEPVVLPLDADVKEVQQRRMISETVSDLDLLTERLCPDADRGPAPLLRGIVQYLLKEFGGDPDRVRAALEQELAVSSSSSPASPSSSSSSSSPSHVDPRSAVPALSVQSIATSPAPLYPPSLSCFTPLPHAHADLMPHTGKI